MATHVIVARRCKKLAARHGRVDMLSDCNEFPIQGPEVSAGFEHLKQMTSPIEKIRIAIVTPSALGRMQAERLLCGPRTRVFASEASALEWLGLA